VSKRRTFPTPLTLRDVLGGAAVGEGVGLHDKAKELRGFREGASLERCGAPCVELALGAAERNDGLAAAVRVQNAAVGLDDAARDALALRVGGGPARIDPKLKSDDKAALILRATREPNFAARLSVEVSGHSHESLHVDVVGRGQAAREEANVPQDVGPVVADVEQAANTTAVETMMLLLRQ
jgi:hypothetical protein